MNQQNKTEALDSNDVPIASLQPESIIRRQIHKLIVQVGLDEQYYQQGNKNALPLDDYYQSLDAMIYAKHLMRTCLDSKEHDTADSFASDQQLIDWTLTIIDNIEEGTDLLQTSRYSASSSLLMQELKPMLALSYALCERNQLSWAMLAYAKANALYFYYQGITNPSVGHDEQYLDYNRFLLIGCLMDGLQALSSTWTRYSLNEQTGQSIKHLTMPTIEHLFHNPRLFSHIKECLSNQNLSEFPEDEQIKADLREHLNSRQVQAFLEAFEQQNRV